MTEKKIIKSHLQKGGGVEHPEICGFRFQDMKIGLKKEFQYTVTRDRMDLFLRLTGDINPLHNDERFAAEHGFSGRVVYGMLSAALISTLGGVYLPGRYCLIRQTAVKFLKPVYIGDVLNVAGTVEELQESVEQAVIKIDIRNQNGEKVLKGKLYAGFLER